MAKCRFDVAMQCGDAVPHTAPTLSPKDTWRRAYERLDLCRRHSERLTQDDWRFLKRFELKQRGAA